MKTTFAITSAALVAAAFRTMAADAAVEAVELAPSDGPAVRVRAGVSYRSGMELKVSGTGFRAAGTASTSTKTTGSVFAGKDAETFSASYGYTGGDRTFGSGTETLGSGSVKADGTYTGGDYSAASDDVYFSDNKTTVETVGGRTTTKTVTTATGTMSWSGDDGLDGWGFEADAEMPALEIGDALDLSLFAGFRAWWGVEGTATGSGAGVSTRTTSTTTGAAVKTTESFYDMIAPLTLDGKLDFENAEVYEGSVVTYAPAAAKSSSKTTTAVSVSKIKAEADIWQIPLGVSLRWTEGRLALALRPALLLTLVDAEATRTEALATTAGKVLGSWRDTGDERKFAFGAGVDLSAEFALSESWSLWLSGGYEWIDSVEMDVGPQKVELDPSAWTVSVGVATAF